MLRTLLAAFLVLIALPSSAATPLTYPDIVHRLYDLRALATPPVSGETTGSATSTDRAAQYDITIDRYLNWGANDDGGGYVRKEGDSIVAADLTGPGVIWRIWSGAPKDGTIRIFIDGAPAPVLDRPFNSLFDTTNGPFHFNNLVRNMSSGWDCFVPIVYQKSCKIVLDPNWGAYYQFTYSKFAPQTIVPSFSGAFDAEDTHALAVADSAWAARGPQLYGAINQQKTFIIYPGKSVSIADFKTPGAITAINCTVYENEETSMTSLLRDVTISIKWDGNQQPAVWSPLGDFFGSGPGYNPFLALPCGMGASCMYSNWYMPFDKAAITLTNDGTQPRKLTFSIVHEPISGSADSLMRFHVKWHRDNWGSAGVGRYAKDRWPDWPILLSAGGPGRFCGVALEIWNPLSSWDRDLASKDVKRVSEICPDPKWFVDNVMNDYWWGEGDEKFFVDGEKYPSTFGTGSEDYFGFAWGTPQFFDSATQCQPLNDGNRGHISVARWHIADNVPFQNSFEASIEKYHGDNWPLLYATTVYWYQTAKTSDIYPPLPIGQREHFYTLPTLAPASTQPPN